MKILDKVYAHLPPWAQHGAVTAYGLYWHWLRFGPGYQRHLRGYLQREQFRSEDWHRWQQDRLKEILFIASEKVPYYRRTWSQSERAAARAGDLLQLPLLEKEPLRLDPYDFVREDVPPHPRFVFHSSGSTGTPIASIWKIQEIRNSLALREARSARWAKTSFSLPRATFSGRMVEPDPESKGPYYRFNRVERQVYLSAFHLGPDTASNYAAGLRRHGVQWLTGYSYSSYLLASFILEQELILPPLRAVITTSEKVTPAMRAVMERAYGCKVYEEYSTVENVLFASECEFGRLHVSPDVALVEILRPDGSPCSPGEVGEVVATCLMRTYQPFVRFRLGDLAAWDDQPCPCERDMPVIKEVVGRLEEAVIGPDGRRMVRFHGLFVEQPRVREGQVIQETLSRIRVRVVPAEGFGQRDIEDIIKRVQQRMGSGFEVVVEAVDSIPRTPAGKFQAVKSAVSEHDLTENG